MVVVAKNSCSQEDHQQQEQNNGKRKNMEMNNESNYNLSLGSLTFEEIYERRFKCVETSYKQSKPYKLALINAAMSQEQKKFPFSIFKHDPNCKYTGDTVNKSEEHILKHITGSKFLLNSGKEINAENLKIEEPEQVAPSKQGSYRFKKIRVRERRKNLQKETSEDLWNHRRK